MYDFVSLIEEVLKNRPDLDRTKLMELIKEKKHNVGAGYLTDQGALFLLAGELGVKLDHLTSADLTLKDLYIGANDITIVARVLSIYPLAEYERKDGTKGRYRRISLFDLNNISKLTLWDDNVETIDKLGITIDSPIRVLNGYVKEGLDGKPSLNVGKRGKVEVVTDENLLSKMTTLNDLIQDVEEVGDRQSVAAVRGTAASDSKTSNFVRDDGSEGNRTQFVLSSEDGKKQLRVVIWNGVNLHEVKAGKRLRITNLRLKQLAHGEQELHGDGGSVIELYERPPKLLRLVSVVEVNGAVEMFVADADKKLYSLLAKEAATEGTKLLKGGNLIEVMPDEETNGKMVCRSRQSVNAAARETQKMPDISSLFTKINEVKNSSGLMMLEVIALSNGALQDVHLKDGSMVMKGELVVGDDTGEIKVTAWREVAEKLRGIQPGERLKIFGAVKQVSKMGVELVQLLNSSRVERVRNR